MDNIELSLTFMRDLFTSSDLSEARRLRTERSYLIEISLVLDIFLTWKLTKNYEILDTVLILNQMFS